MRKREQLCFKIKEEKQQLLCSETEFFEAVSSIKQAFL